VTTKLRMMVGGTALVAGLWALSAVAAAPILPKDTYKKVAEADVAELQQLLKTIEGDWTQAKRAGPTVKSIAMMLAMYGEATGDKDLKEKALKVGEASVKLLAEAKKSENEKGTLEANAAVAKAVKELAVKGGTAPLAPAGLQKMNKYSLEEVMSPFRGKTVGGLNIDRDIKDFIKSDMPTKIDPAAIELLAARAAVLGEYMAYFPNEKASVNKANEDKWKMWSKQTLDMSKALAEEAAKGKGADEKKLLKGLQNLAAKCSDCHSTFRDD
jgi:Cytochrome C'